jgi:hypothetical protein
MGAACSMERRILDVSLPPLYHWIMERSRGERGVAFLHSLLSTSSTIDLSSMVVEAGKNGEDRWMRGLPARSCCTTIIFFVLSCRLARRVSWASPGCQLLYRFAFLVVYLFLFLISDVADLIWGFS